MKLTELYKRLEEIPDERWCTGPFAKQPKGKTCFLGHMYHIISGNKDNPLSYDGIYNVKVCKELSSITKIAPYEVNDLTRTDGWRYSDIMQFLRTPELPDTPKKRSLTYLKKVIEMGHNFEAEL